MVTKMSSLLSAAFQLKKELTYNYCGFCFVLNLGKMYLEFVGVKPKVAVFENV